MSWELKIIRAYRYAIENLAVESIVWADIFTRWGARTSQNCNALKLELFMYDPINADSKQD